jgi:serine/threonine protein kinase
MEAAAAGGAFGHYHLDARLGNVPGVTLDVLLRRGPLQTNDIVRLGAQLARGLADAHFAGIVHGDIRPGKLKVTPDGLLKILGFGVAPDTAGGSRLDPRMDIFSAGAVLYEMTCGRPPFADTHPVRLIEAILNGKVPLPSQVYPGVHPSLERIIIRAIEPLPARRFASAATLAEALEALAPPHHRPNPQSLNRESLILNNPESVDWVSPCLR